ncbi:uncharacterized protein PG998_001127 [Apiospora kogelbergensis]|uniref:uncharacterized protein n=1 Tax=Apiospora kogelbergensis TaxID=1337665 RepID=UPI00312E6D48
MESHNVYGGWKSKKTEKNVGTHIPTNPSVMRWDGAARSSSSWDSLRRDPELWYREGDCYVHLYGRGQSQRGPAFRIPFPTLLKADCYPLVEKCDLVINVYPGSWHTAFAAQAVSDGALYPGPPGLDKRQAYRFHLATRNFFAFLCRRSLVGEHLGSALITLAETMHLFRTPDVDNLADLMSYMDEEGYLYLKSQPSHALAILHLAEVLQIRDLYINAFAHCCGMSDQLFLGPEYQLVSSVTRRLIRRAKVEMELRLGQMGSMLKTFLQDELSEAHLGLNPGARAHLERGVYAAKFGYYPPPSIDPRTTVFELDVFRVMSRDFEALYSYLVNEDLDSTQGVPIVSQGGICTLQSVQAFDARYKFTTLPKPSPLLPRLQPTTLSKRTSWFGIYAKPGATQKANTHVALLKATNQGKAQLLENDLVRAYRKFEEDSIYNPLKADRLENLSPVDARKVRWILVYAVHQCLRQVMQPPPEIKDPANTPYHLCISTTNIPPWKDELPVHPNFQTQLTEITRNPSISTLRWSAFSGYQTPPLTPQTPDYKAEIKPDIDYFALSRQRNASDTKLASTNPRTPTKRSSITKSLRETRRSMGLFMASPTEAASAQASRKSAQYHEIVVHGYGNGTNDVEFASQRSAAAETGSDTYTTRTPSTASETGGSLDGTNSEHGTISTKGTSIADSSCVESPTPMTPTLPAASNNHFSWASRRSSICVPARSRVSIDNFDAVSPPPRSLTICAKSPPRLRRHLQMPARPSGLPKQRSHSVNHHDYRKSMEPLPLQIRKTSREEADAILRAGRPRPLPLLETKGESDTTITTVASAVASSTATPGDDGDALQIPVPSSPTVWDDIKALMEVRASRLGFPSGTGDDILPEWDMYGLGGLTEPKP